MRRGSEQGFTLMEVMVAMAILAVGLTSVVAVFARATASISQVEGYERAWMEAQTRLADFLNGEVDASHATSGRSPDLPAGTWRIQSRQDQARPGVSTVTVEVRFAVGGRDHALVLETAQADMTLPVETTSEQTKGP